jgi:hypothetical protein
MGNIWARACVVAALGACGLLCLPSVMKGQSAAGKIENDGPVESLSAALSAACRQDEAGFAKYLTKENAAAFQGLAADRRKAVIRRFSLSDDPGKPLLTGDANHRQVVRCENPSVTSEFHLGAARVDENLAFVPVQIVGGNSTDFGLLRQSDSWKVISVGLVMFDIGQLSAHWAEEDLQDRETAAMRTLQELADAVERYRRAFGALPDSLEQLGPASKGEVGPEQASLISADLASGVVGGYKFRYQVVTHGDPDSLGFQLSGIPSDYGRTGRRSFLLDSVGGMHGADKRGEPAGIDDATVEVQREPAGESSSGSTSSPAPSNPAPSPQE